MEYGCIGERLPHSFSKEIHALFADYAYELKELTPDQIPAFMRDKTFRGINVTIPYKQTVIPFLDEISPEARTVGAVNTIVNRNGRLLGYNTDVFGMNALLKRTGIPLKGSQTAILGTGGTSRTAAYVARMNGAEKILRVSRTGKEDAITYENLLRLHPDVGVLINTTPCGMYPHAEGCPADPLFFPALRGVADAVYNPLRTRLVLAARAAGVPAAGGLYMLTAQAVAAYGIFTGREPPAELTDETYEKILRQKENVVLTGMPACGKTTVGKIIARRLNRRLIDTDDLIAEKTGMSIPEIFARDGERAFRDLESAIIREVSTESGVVIATGGGAVLREENVAALRQNGRLCFLDRSLSLLRPTADRPTAFDKATMDRRYAERIGIYRATSDLIVQGDGSPEETADSLLKRFTYEIADH